MSDSHESTGSPEVPPFERIGSSHQYSADERAEDSGTREAEPAGHKLSVASGEDEDGLRELRELIDGVLSIADQLQKAPGKKVTIPPREAAYLQQIPHQLLSDITKLAIRRVQMREGHDYMQKGDIDWAWERLVVGQRNSGVNVVMNTIGGLVFGAGLPILLGPLAAGTEFTAGATMLGSGLSLAGVAALTIGLTRSLIRR